MARWMQEERRVWGVQGGFVMERLAIYTTNSIF